MSSSPKEVSTNANNKRALSSEPDSKDANKRANILKTDEDEDDITADDAEKPTTTSTTTTEDKPKMEGDDVTMEATEEAAAP